MMSGVIAPPGAPPASGAQALGRLLDLLAVSGPTREGVRDAVLIQDQHKEQVERHELSKVQFAAHMKSEADKLQAMLDVETAAASERRAALASEIASFDRRQADAKERVAEARKLVNEVSFPETSAAKAAAEV